MKVHYPAIDDTGEEEETIWNAPETFCGKVITSHRATRFPVTRDQKLVECMVCQSKLTQQRRMGVTHDELTPILKAGRINRLRKAQSLIEEATELAKEATEGTEFDYAHYGKYPPFKITDSLKKIKLGLNNTIKDIVKQT